MPYPDLTTEQYRAALENAAVLYLERGYAIIPLSTIRLNAKGKKQVYPLIKWQREGPITDLQGWGWWLTDPESGSRDFGGLAIATGPSGVLAVDLDDYKGHGTELELPADAWTQTTASGGRHVFLRNDMGARNTAGRMAGVDTRGDGGLVIVAPSRVEGSGGYMPGAGTLLDLPHPSQLPPVPDHMAATFTGSKASTSVAQKAGVPAASTADGWYGDFLKKGPQSIQAAQKAISRKLDDVRRWTAEGSPDNFRMTLMRAALTYGGYVGGGLCDRDAAEAQLQEAVCQVWGTPDDDDLLWIDQGLTNGIDAPFPVYDPAEGVPEVAPEFEAAPGVPEWSTALEFGGSAFDPAGLSSDQELAAAVLYRMLPVLRFGEDSGQWLTRGPVNWYEREDMSGWAVSRVAQDMPLGAAPRPKEKSEWEEAHWQSFRRDAFLSSAGAGKVERKIKTLVRSREFPGTVTVADLDQEPEVLWAGGLPWDLRGSADVPKLADLDPATPHLHTAKVAPGAGTPTPLFDRFLTTVWPDAEVRAWALRVLSIALTGYPDAALPVLYGPERTGKTAIVSLLMDVLGSYAHAADSKLLASTEGHPSAIYALKGRRLSFIDEGPRRGQLATERLKQITGGGVLTGHAMRANPVSFRTTHTLVMTTNDEPPVTDPALLARMRIIPVEGDQVAVREARQALTPARWSAEMPGVLALLMRESAAWLADRDSALTSRGPAAVQSSVDEMSAAQDPVREWVTSCTVPADPGTPGRELYKAFCAWIEQSAMYRRAPQVSETRFGRSLTDQGYPAAKHDGKWYRPLAHLGGGGGGLFTPVAGSGGFVAGFKPEAATTQNPSSAPVLKDSDTGLAGSLGSMTTTSSSIKTYTEKGATKPPPASGSANTAPDQAKQVRRVESAATRQNPPGFREVDTTDLLHNLDGTPKEQGSRTKMEASLKKLEKRKAIVAANGPVIGLPAVVNRQGVAMKIDADQVEAVITAAMARSGFLTVDVETTGYPVGHPLYAMRTIQLGDDVAAVKVANTPEWRAVAARHLHAAPSLSAHNMVADLVPLALEGVVDFEAAMAKMVDTAILAKLADPNLTENSADLKGLALALLKDQAVSKAADERRSELFKLAGWKTDVNPAKDPIEKSGWAQVDNEALTMVVYAASDVLDCAAIRKVIPMPDATVLAREQHIQRVTARASLHGVKLDRALTAEQRQLHAGEKARVDAHNAETWGLDNAKSPAQVLAAFADMDVKLANTQASTLENVAKNGAEMPAQLAKDVLASRHEGTLLSLFLEPWSVLTEKGDGRARPTIYTLGADTGRMSCVRPNLQQVPREGGMREILVADEGMSVIAADFSSVEVRVLAAVSGDETLKRMISEGLDLHKVVAEALYGPEESMDPKLWKRCRYGVKRGVFGKLYGGGVETLAAQVGVTEDEMWKIIGMIEEITPVAGKMWPDQVKAGVRAGHSKYTAYSGRVIHLDPSMPHKAVNYIVQGTARELLGDALIRWDESEFGGGVVLPVHDEIVAFTPTETADRALRVLVGCMETEIYGVPITVEADAPVERWSSAA